MKGGWQTNSKSFSMAAIIHPISCSSPLACRTWRKAGEGGICILFFQYCFIFFSSLLQPDYRVLDTVITYLLNSHFSISFQSISKIKTAV